MERTENSLILKACITEVQPLRYTPAGLPALDLRLVHESEIVESGLRRELKAEIKAVAFGQTAETIVKQEIGSIWRFSGFITTPRNGKSVVFHVQELTQD